MKIPLHGSSTPFGCREGHHTHDIVGTGCRAFASWQVSSIESDTDHLVLQAAPGRLSHRSFVICSACGPARLTRTRTLRVLGERAVGYRLGMSEGSIFAGHTVVVWHSGGRTYGFGFHGRGDRAGRLNAYLARHLRFVR
jgi:hypothetical protein